MSAGWSERFALNEHVTATVHAARGLATAEIDGEHLALTRAALAELAGDLRRAVIGGGVPVMPIGRSFTSSTGVVVLPARVERWLALTKAAIEFSEGGA